MIGVETADLGRRVLDVVGQVGLQGLQSGDLGTLRRDVLPDLGLPGASIAQLITLDGRRRAGCADDPENEREEKEKRSETATELSAPGVTGA